MTDRAIQSASRLFAPALAETLKALNLSDEDAAAAKLAEAYARELDGAAALAAKAREVLHEVHGSELNAETLLERVEALKDALSARTALSTIGPKLAAVLVELGATPKARAQFGKTKAPVVPGADALAALRAVPGA